MFAQRVVLKAAIVLSLAAFLFALNPNSNGPARSFDYIPLEISGTYGTVVAGINDIGENVGSYLDSRFNVPEFERTKKGISISFSFAFSFRV